VLLAGSAATGLAILLSVVVAAAAVVEISAALTGLSAAVGASAAASAAAGPALELAALLAPELLLALADLALVGVVRVLGHLIAGALAAGDAGRDLCTVCTERPPLLELVHLCALPPAAAAAEDGVAEGATRATQIGGGPLGVQLLLDRVEGVAGAAHSRLCPLDLLQASRDARLAGAVAATGLRAGVAGGISVSVDLLLSFLQGLFREGRRCAPSSRIGGSEDGAVTAATRDEGGEVARSDRRLTCGLLRTEVCAVVGPGESSCGDGGVFGRGGEGCRDRHSELVLMGIWDGESCRLATVRILLGRSKG
jgi:hypothetical protein